MSYLTADLTAVRGDFALRVALAAAAGEVVCVLGPNGAGKTTLLRALAGLLPLASGRVELAGEVLEDVTTGSRWPAERRPVAVVFQDYLLFPRMTARDNVAFGLRARGVGKAAASRVAEQWLSRMGLTGLGDRRPSALSGGQSQRVALARALAVEPSLLLLDEPLAALDAGARADVRGALRTHLTEYVGVTLIITHDPLEALILGDRLVVLEAGRVVQDGPPDSVARHPRTDYVARLVGLNLYRGSAAGGSVTVDGGTATLAVLGDHAGPVFAAVRPSAVAVHRQRPQGSPRNVWPGVVSALELAGDRVRVQVGGRLQIAVDVTPAAVADLHLRPGAEIWLAVKATDIAVYPI